MLVETGPAAGRSNHIIHRRHVFGRIRSDHIGFLQDLCPLVRPGWARSEDDGCIITFLGGGERCQFQGHNRISFEHKTNIKWNAN
jgi:hypothetical protein